MITITFNYLIESSLCILLFMITYRILISRLTHFSWMRIYLNCSLVLSLLLPIIIIPIQWHSNLMIENSLSKALLPVQQSGKVILNNHTNSSEVTSWFSFQELLIYILLTIYLIGVIYKAFNFAKNLKTIYGFIKQSPKVKKSNYWIVNIKSEIPAFSFFNYIFINENFKNLSENDFQIIKKHELVHVNQYHTIDVLFVEFIDILFWFNPLLKYLKKSLLEIHEYIADEKVAGEGENKVTYANLLLKLASETKIFSLVASFTGEHIKRRIIMMAKPRTSPKSKLFVIILVPITTMLLLSFSYIKYSAPQLNSKSKQIVSSEIKIGEISWKGNMVYSNETLNSRLGLKSGDNYNAEDLQKRLMTGDVQSLYLNNGYAFYNADIVEHAKANGQIDLTIIVNEGLICKVGAISVKGNKNVPTNDILAKILIKTGDVFSKNKIHNSLFSIVSLGKFDSEKINISPILNSEKSTEDFAVLDLEFEVLEINKK